MRYHKGDDVTFIWTFTDIPETIINIDITYNTDIIVRRLISGQVSIDGNYKDRVTFEELDKSIKLILKDVSDDDVIHGVYRLAVVFAVGVTSSSLNDNKAELYLFDLNNAFEGADHLLVLNSLSSQGIKGQLIALIVDFLRNKTIKPKAAQNEPVPLGTTLTKGAIRDNLPPVARALVLHEFKMESHIKARSNTSCYK
ncbi:hypothetical protein LSH36_1715g00004 [Paralvinella palmiformis]|uniref:Uncharacterized protein n=1 Tax=Paralvinella palmiformis TaxID=53620 RepID=A0AAD9IRB7_9ANNE|nr:hypothetical protein LSH36_1715g00004 [Paralvinella palmiformis]